MIIAVCNYLNQSKHVLANLGFVFMEKTARGLGFKKCEKAARNAM